MVNKGWPPAFLLALPAREFGFWFDEQDALAQAEAEALAKARGKGGGKGRR